MIIFLYGPDNFRSKEKLKEIILSYKKVHSSGLNLVYFDCIKNNFSDLQNIFKVAGMFAEKKLVVLKNLFTNKKFQEDVFSALGGPALGGENIIVIYEEDKVDERLKIFKDLNKNVKCQEFEYLTGPDLAKWLALELSKNNIKMEALAQNLLINFVGNDLWQMQNEIIKLSNYVSCEALAKQDKVITSDDVRLLVKPKINNDIFKTIEALALKNKKQALDLIHKHIENGDHALYLLSMITYQFRTLLIIKESGGKKTGLHPFVVQKTLPLCNKFTFEELKSIYQKIFEIDTDIKIGKIDPELAIDMLVAEI